MGMVVDIGEVTRHIKPKADNTLRNMRKDDLIEYIRCLENNYNVAVSFNNQQAKNIESLDVAPVVHARWDEWWPPKHMILTGEEMLYRCSSCTAKYADISGLNYCPFCGAKMDLQEETTDEAL